MEMSSTNPMKHHVIWIEGLPGSGKTTFAKRLGAYYETRGIDVVQYNEGDLNPIDLAWCSYLDQNGFDQILKQYPDFYDEIMKHTIKEDGHYITAYTKIKKDQVNQAFFDEMSKHEVYRWESRKAFLEVHQKRWHHFNQNFDPNKLYIFECSFLQNHITELILNDDATKDEIIAYFKALSSKIENTDPMVFYIKQNDIDSILNRLIEERRTNDKTRYRDWIDNVVLYLESTMYGQTQGFTEIDGMRRYENHRQKMELEVLKSLDVTSFVFELDEDYETVFEKMKEISIIT